MRLRIILAFIIFTNCLMLFSQKLELFGGASNNVFHDYNNGDGHYESSYNSGFGYCAGVGVDSIKIDWLTLRFTLQFDQYKGELTASDGGLGGGFTTIANINKSIISLGVFPINFRFFQRLDLNFGFLISTLINESYTGTSSGWAMDQPNWSYNLEDKYSQYSSKIYFGLQGRVAYDFKLAKSICISPQYLYYFGLSNEFVEFPKETKAMRHYFCVGLKKKFN